MPGEQFSLAVKAKIAERSDTEEYIEFPFTLEHDSGMVEERTIKMYKPTTEQWAITMVLVGNRHDLGDRIAAVIDLLMELMDEDDAGIFAGLLLDHRRPLTMDQITELLAWYIQEWSARPTEPPSDSTTSQSTGGQKSKRRTTKSTSSASVSTAT